MLRSTRQLFEVARNVSSASRCSYSTGASSLSRPLSIFVCAADEASDSAGAALVASLKQLHKQGVQLFGVGGPLLQAQGLHSVITDYQYQQLATAEVVQQAYGLHKLHGISTASRSAYLKIFRDTIWEAALHGCSSRDKAAAPTAAPQQQQQQQQGPAGLLAAVTYDAVLTIGSPTASQQVLFVLRKAEEAKKARLPVAVHYMVPGLWDYQQVSAAAAAWSKLTDHTMCSLPFEPQLMHAAGGPASFVGHPVVQPLLQQGIGSRQPLVVRLLQQRAAAGNGADSASSSSSSSSRGVGQQALFGVGDAASFWRMFDSLHSTQHTSSSSSSNESSSAAATTATATTGFSGRKGRPTAAAAAAAAPASGQHADRLLLCLLPGSTESEVINSMPAFDDVTKELLQQFPNLVAAMILPDLLVEAAVAATNNYSLPVVVLPASSNLSTNALAAAAAALSHPGPESLRAAAAGLPMVCVRGGSLLKDGLARWRRQDILPYGNVVNLVLGRQAVPGFNLWQRGGREGAVSAVAELLAAGSSSSCDASGWQDQRAALQDVLLELVPQRQTIAAPAAAAAAAGVSSAGSTGVSRVVGVHSPSEAAAGMLLELVALRKQQEAEQLQALGASQQQ